jgi:hypothetical protein
MSTDMTIIVFVQLSTTHRVSGQKSPKVPEWFSRPDQDSFLSPNPGSPQLLQTSLDELLLYQNL